MAKCIAVIGALDTKGDEFWFVKKEIENRGYNALVINVGIADGPGFEPEVGAEKVAGAAGSSLEILKAKADRGLAIQTMTRGIGQIMGDLYSAGRIQAVISMGGSDAVCIVTELITLDETEMQKLIRNDGGIILPFFANNLDAGVNKLKFANLSGQSSLDGFRCPEHWWFESA